jgi:hypothetical protein
VDWFYAALWTNFTPPLTGVAELVENGINGASSRLQNHQKDGVEPPNESVVSQGWWKLEKSA